MRNSCELWCVNRTFIYAEGIYIYIYIYIYMEREAGWVVCVKCRYLLRFLGKWTSVVGEEWVGGRWVGGRTGGGRAGGGGAANE